MSGNQMLFGVPDETLGITRSSGVKIYIWKVVVEVSGKVGFFRYCTGKLLEDSGGFRRGPEVHKWFHQGLAWAAGRRPGLIGLGASRPQKPMWLGKAKKEGVLVGIGLDLESKSSPP